MEISWMLVNNYFQVFQCLYIFFFRFIPVFFYLFFLVKNIKTRGDDKVKTATTNWIINFQRYIHYANDHKNFAREINNNEGNQSQFFGFRYFNNIFSILSRGIMFHNFFLHIHFLFFNLPYYFLTTFILYQKKAFILSRTNKLKIIKFKKPLEEKKN